jgi:NitT/TauT family transport system permease protein
MSSATTATAATTATIPSRILARGSVYRAVLAPLVFGVVFLGLWQALVMLLHIEANIVPSPLAIAAEFTANLDSVVSGALRTGANALIGLVVGSLVGIGGAVLANVAGVVDRLAAPLVAALSVMPIVALAPVLYLNTLRGLRQVRPVHRDLMRVYAATARQQQFAVTLPTAAPYAFTGLRIGSSLAVISALVAEYFGGPVGGLGKSITSAAASSNYPLAWAYVLGSILLGLVFYGAALGVERWTTRHRRVG